MFTRSAAFYDGLYAGKDYGLASAYLTSALRQLHPQARSLLEVACGTGRYLEHLQKDFTVAGLDINAELLAIARQRLPAAPLHDGDMTGFDLGTRYDVVACLFSSIAYVRTAEALTRTIIAMAAHVAPGGILAIEPFFPPERYWTGHLVMNTTDLPDMKIAWMYVMQRQGDIGIMDIHYMVAQAGGVDTFNEVHELGLFTDVQFVAAFAAAGMTARYDAVGPMGRGLYLAQRT